MDTDASETLPLNTWFPIVVTLPRIVAVFIEEQPVNNDAGKLVTPLGRHILLSDLQESNELVPKDITVEGMLIEFRLEQPLNALFPIAVTLLGNEMDWNE